MKVALQKESEGNKSLHEGIVRRKGSLLAASLLLIMFFVNKLVPVMFQPAFNFQSCSSVLHHEP